MEVDVWVGGSVSATNGVSRIAGTAVCVGVGVVVDVTVRVGTGVGV